MEEILKHLKIENGFEKANIINRIKISFNFKRPW